MTFKPFARPARAAIAGTTAVLSLPLAAQIPAKGRMRRLYPVVSGALLAGLLASTALAQVTPAQTASPEAAPAASAPPSAVQEPLWIQVEALPTLAQAEERARAWGALFPDVSGFRLGAAWYGIAIGPFATREAGEARLADLTGEGTVPSDAYLIEASRLGARYWPVGAPPLATVAPAAEPVAEPVAPAADPAAAADPATGPAAEPIPAEPAFVEETPEEARRAEAALDRDARKELQTALQWFGFYTAKIDGAFGPGTRKSMAAWQEANGLEPTGILTTLQRETLVAAHQAAIAAYGFQTIEEGEAGIEATLPMALVEFDHYEPPFVHFKPKVEGGPRIVLISEPGDAATLSGLYDLLTGLQAIPTDGPREKGEKSFTLEGRDGARAARAFATQGKGAVKGWLVLWDPAQDEDVARIVSTLEASFRPVGSKSLDPGMVPMSDSTAAGLMGGLEMRAPAFSRSGVYVDGAGAVLTLAEVVTGCDRVTLDLGTDAEVVASEGPFALVKPQRALAPLAVAGFAPPPPQGAEIAVAGFGYEDQLPAATLTFGGLSAITGLGGEAGLIRLSANLLPGDAGGPVLDAKGAVIGLALPIDPKAERQLPPGVALAADATALEAFLQGAGQAAQATAATAPLPPEDLAKAGRDMTVLVSCWK